MVSFTPFTRPQSPGQTYLPLSDEVLLMGAKSAYDQKDKTAQKIGATYNSLFGISTYGKDAEVLSQFQQDFENQVGELSKANLRDPEVTSKINSLITQYSSNPDVLNIHKRASVYANELQNKKDYESKGKQYVSPAIRQAEKYYNSGVYTRDTQFNKSGFVAPDNKELDEIAKNTPEWENWVTKGGYDIHQKGKAESSLYNNYLAHFTNNPQWSALLNDQFEQEVENIDLNNVVNQGLDGVKQLFPYLPPDKQQEAYNDLLEGLSIQQTNPYFQSAVKDKLRNDYFQNQAYMAAQAKTYVNTVDKKANDFAKSARDFQEAKELELYKRQIEQEYTKDNEGILSLVKGLEEFKTTKKRIPGLLNTDIFIKESTKPKETVTYEYDAEGNKTPKSTTIVESKEKIKPEAVGYREADDTFTIRYEDGSVDQLTTQQILDKVAASKPTLAKYLKNISSTQNTFDKSNLDSKTLKALQDNIAANPGVSEIEIAKAMGLIQ